MSSPTQQAKSIFLEAVEKHAPAQWPPFLEQACAGDVVLRRAVEKLLHAQAGIGSFHEQPLAPQGATVDEPFRERPGTVVGPYQLLEQIGEGGFGVVFIRRASSIAT